jgi:hypothetical protein
VSSPTREETRFFFKLENHHHYKAHKTHTTPHTMRKRNNQGESKTMVCRHFTNAANTNHNHNHKQRSSTLVPSQTPKRQHGPWSFPVGRNVHDRSWGKRTTIKRAGRQNHTMICTPGNGFRQSEPWSAADFSILEKLGEGHFGSVFRAKFTSGGAFCARRSAATSMERGRHYEQDGRDDMEDGNNNSFRDDDDTRDNKDGSTGGTSSAFPKYVALKRFCKSRIQQSHQRGSRALELLRREVNIHSQ